MKILLEGIKLYAYHGCLPEESKIGCNYIIDIVIKTDFELASITDDLSKTIDYCRVYDIVKEEMAIPSKLIEHVAKRISRKLSSTFPHITASQIKVSKLNPPVNGEIEKVSVIID